MKNKVLIVQANYYKDISTALLKSALNELKNFAKINIISVPGVFEIPVVISKNLKKYDCFVFCYHDQALIPFKYILKKCQLLWLLLVMQYQTE